MEKSSESCEERRSPEESSLDLFGPPEQEIVMKEEEV